MEAPHFLVIMTGNVKDPVFLKHLLCLGHQGSLLLYVHVRQSFIDSALVPLVLFCHNLKLPYIICPLQIKSYCLRCKPQLQITFNYDLVHIWWDNHILTLSNVFYLTSRTVLQKVGVILLPPSALTEIDAEKDRVYSAVMKAVSWTFSF